MKNTILDFKNRRDCYRMVINLNDFMQTKSINRMKKLVEYIQESDAPEELDKIRDWLSDYLGSYEAERKGMQSIIAENVRKVELTEEDLKTATKDRAKDLKRLIRGLKENIRYYERELVKWNKMREFCLKVSGVLNG